LIFPGLGKLLAIVAGALIFTGLVTGMAGAIGLVPFLLLCLLVSR
jgi:hypothetical protein